MANEQKRGLDRVRQISADLYRSLRGNNGNPKPQTPPKSEKSQQLQESRDNRDASAGTLQHEIEASKNNPLPRGVSEVSPGQSVTPSPTPNNLRGQPVDPSLYRGRGLSDNQRVPNPPNRTPSHSQPSMNQAPNDQGQSIDQGKNNSMVHSQTPSQPQSSIREQATEAARQPPSKAQEANREKGKDHER